MLPRAEAQQSDHELPPGISERSVDNRTNLKSPSPHAGLYSLLGKGMDDTYLIYELLVSSIRNEYAGKESVYFG